MSAIFHNKTVCRETMDEEVKESNIERSLSFSVTEATQKVVVWPEGLMGPCSFFLF